MTRDESTKICYVIQCAYPDHYKQFDKVKTETMIDLWASMIPDYTYEQVNAGLSMFIRSDKKGFPPVPGQVIDQIEKLRPDDETSMTEAEAWHVVKSAIGDAIYHAQERFDGLPDVLKRAVGSSTNLYEWATMDESNLSVVESNVMRSFRAAVKMERDDRLVPQDIKRLTETLFPQIEQKEAI